MHIKESEFYSLLIYKSCDYIWFHSTIPRYSLHLQHNNCHVNQSTLSSWTNYTQSNCKIARCYSNSNRKGTMTTGLLHQSMRLHCGAKIHQWREKIIKRSSRKQLCRLHHYKFMGPVYITKWLKWDFQSSKIRWSNANKLYRQHQIPVHYQYYSCSGINRDEGKSKGIIYSIVIITNGRAEKKEERIHRVEHTRWDIRLYTCRIRVVCEQIYITFIAHTNSMLHQYFILVCAVVLLLVKGNAAVGNLQKFSFALIWAGFAGFRSSCKCER